MPVQHAARPPGGFPAPPSAGIATPIKLDATLPNPRLDEPPPAGRKLTPHTGPYSLQAIASDRDVRTVTIGDLGEIASYLPRYYEHHPRATPEGLLPVLRLAILGGNYRFLRTDNAFALFVFARLPDDPMGEVNDYFIVGRPDADPKLVGWEVVKLARAGMEWAVSLGASKFSIGEDNGYDVSPLAKRLQMNEVSKRYSKRLF